MPQSSRPPRIAVLIDADNISSKHAKQILKLARAIGTVTIRKAYGDWNKPQLKGHKAVFAKSVKTVQVDRTGKDSTDKQMLIEAGELLGKGETNVFLIVSSDSDFRQLCQRIKEKGKIVIGIGNEPVTSESLIEACHLFFFIDQLEILSKVEKVDQPETLMLLLRAYLEVRSSKGVAHVSKMREFLHKVDKTHFKENFTGRFSKWIDAYPQIFTRKEQHVRLKLG
jgi:uncharacterized protein (TIGR00288 family)